MKKIIALLLTLTVLLCIVGCQGTNPLVSNSPSGEQKKTTLKLNHKLGIDPEQLTENQEMVMVEVDFIEINLVETEYTKYSEGVLPELVSLINHEYPGVLNSNWEYMVHFYDDQETAGIVQFRYVINGNILTDKGIVFNYENGVINSVAYSNISKSVDEEDIVSRVNSFSSKYEQEKKKLKEDEEFIKETVQYSYDYDMGKLIYTYNLFFYKGQYELRCVDNSTVTEYFIDKNGNAVE